MAEHDVEQVWHDFWVPILDEACMEHPDGWGSIELPRAALDQIKRELYDFRMFIKELPAFFDEITGGMASKPNIDLKVIMELVDERIDEAYDRGYFDGRDDALEDE